MKFWFGQKNKDQEASESAVSSPEAVAEPVSDPAAIAPAAEPAPAPEETPAPEPAEPVSASAPEARGPVEPPVQASKQPPAEAPKAAPNARTQFLELINGLYDAIFILDDSGHVVCGNKRVQKVLGYTEDDLWNLPITKVVKGMHALIFKQMRDALHNSQQVLVNTKCVHKDGTEFLAEVGVSLVHLMRNENLVFSVRNVEGRVTAIRSQIAKELAPRFPEAAAVLSPQTKSRLVLKKSAAQPSKG